MSFWNSGPTYHTAGVVILFSENFKGKIQNIVHDNAGRIITITFTLKKQNFHITTLYGSNKPHHRENFFQSLTNHTTSTQNTIIDGDFNMVIEFTDKTGGAICNTHLLRSIPLNELLKNQNLQDTWRKIHPNKINYTYHRTLSNIHSRLDRIYSSQNLNIIDSKILPFQYSDHDAVFAEFLLSVRTRAPGYWKLNTSILDHETFRIAFQTFWQEWKQQQKDYKDMSTWWEVGKLYFKMLATQYCVQMQKNIRNKQDELTQFITIEKTKANPNQDKIQEAHQHLQDIDNYKISGSIIRSKEKMILEQEKPNKFFFHQEKQKQK